MAAVLELANLTWNKIEINSSDIIIGKSVLNRNKIEKSSSGIRTGTK